MKTRVLKNSIMTLALIMIAAIASSCSKSQTEVNSFISSLNEFGQNIKEASTPQELNEINASFINEMQKFSESKAELTDADREAIAKAIGSLGTITNNKFAELTSGAAPLTQQQIDQRLEEFKQAIDKCETLGDVVKIGL